jgi:uncharacterized protein (TIGR00297 family)
MQILNWIFLFLISAGVIISIKTNKLTTGGAITGGIIAILIQYGAGSMNVILLATYFILAIVATNWKRKEKQLLRKEETIKRDAVQVLANGGIAGLCGLAALMFPYNLSLFIFLLAASLSSAIADTLSSELGTVYGKNFVNILSLKKDKKGLDGVVSLEGTLIGIAGSFIIALLYSWVSGWTYYSTLIVIAGTIGNFADSILGASLERKGIIGNNAVNFLNTLIASLSAFLLLKVINLF